MYIMENLLVVQMFTIVFLFICRYVLYIQANLYENDIYIYVYMNDISIYTDDICIFLMYLIHFG